ncbi:uncharacterized protein [Setaria viridis]|uniref:uncharacterized protein n=1 Tax=Setaria viridis TaxID=4556 RepID=UPI0014933045|nr:uncharacterized protein LOC117834126 [Setaria viridis]
MPPPISALLKGTPSVSKRKLSSTDTHQRKKRQPYIGSASRTPPDSASAPYSKNEDLQEQHDLNQQQPLSSIQEEIVHEESINQPGATSSASLSPKNLLNSSRSAADEDNIQGNAHLQQQTHVQLDKPSTSALFSFSIDDYVDDEEISSSLKT